MRAFFVALGAAVVLAAGVPAGALAQSSPPAQQSLKSALSSSLSRAGGRDGAYVVDLTTGQALFSGRAVPMVARFSLAGGDPNASDAEKSPRGMALEFRLPGDHLQHMTMLDTPTFFAAMPRTFLDKILALKPDPATGKPDPAALAAFAKMHPEISAW